MATTAIIVTEGCNLHYWYHGSGPLLLFVPGGNGHGRQYNHIMAQLSSYYTVATFDRRQMSASIVSGPNKTWNPVQQARDIIAVIKAVGFEKAHIFCSSGGGLNGLQLAVSYPEVIETLILHEPPVNSLLDREESTEMIDFLTNQQEVLRTSGIGVAMKAFREKILVGMDSGPALQTPEPGNPINQIENEIWMGMYCPDLYKVKESGKRVVVGYGEGSGEASYVKSGRVLKDRLECEWVKFPGHHQGFESLPEEFAGILKKVLEKETIDD